MVIKQQEAKLKDAKKLVIELKTNIKILCKNVNQESVKLGCDLFNDAGALLIELIENSEKSKSAIDEALNSLINSYNYKIEKTKDINKKN
ncbi:MAG: hypothetical protein HQK91_13280 [Nitrospirae bacterium]|nr:hypothetical protein [Nitrospirota bacterium]MBF0542409.1 hypothetical protein [Nitrospirota bacterium]